MTVRWFMALLIATAILFALVVRGPSKEARIVEKCWDAPSEQELFECIDEVEE